MVNMMGAWRVCWVGGSGVGLLGDGLWVVGGKDNGGFEGRGGTGNG